MAFENIPVANILPDIVTIYGYAPWLWDGIIICTIMGLFFREGFKKINMEEKHGGIFGFATGLITVIGIHAMGWKLIDIFPWILVAMLVFGGILLRKWLLEQLGDDHSTWITIGVIAVGILFLGLLLGAMPEMGIIFGGWGALITVLAFWGGIIGLLVWAGSRLIGAGGDRDYGTAESTGRPGLLRRIATAPFRAAGTAAGAVYGGFKEGKALATPDKGIEKIERTGGEVGDSIDKADKTADEASTAVKNAKQLATNIAKLKEEIAEFAGLIETEIDEIFGQEEKARKKRLSNYKSVLTDFENALKKRYSEFKYNKVITEFLKTHHVYDTVGRLLRELINWVNATLQTLRDKTGPQINSLTNPEKKSALLAKFNKHYPTIQEVDRELAATYTKFQKDVAEALGHSQEKSVAKLIDDLKKETETLIIRMSGLQSALGKDDVGRIKGKCTDIITKCNAIDEKYLDPFINEYAAYLEASIKAIKNACDNVVKPIYLRAFETIEKIKPDIIEISDEAKRLAEEEAAQKAGAKKEAKDLEEVKANIATEKEELQKIINSAKKLVNKFSKEFQTWHKYGRGITPKEAGLKKMQMKKEGVDLRIGSILTLDQDLKKELDAASEIVEKSIKRVNNAVSDITRLVHEGKIPVEKSTEANTLKDNLTKFMQHQTAFKEKLDDFSTYLKNAIKQKIDAEKTVPSASTILKFAQDEVTSLENELAWLTYLSTKKPGMKKP